MTTLRKTTKHYRSELAMALLDEAHNRLSKAISGDGDPRAAFDVVVTALLEIRRRASIDSWDRFARVDCLNHPLRDLVHQDPFTKRAFEKPRGYAGDAWTLDYMYGQSGPMLGDSEVGKAILEFTTASPASEGVKNRKTLLAKTADRVARNTAGIRILSMASGFLREAAESQALSNGAVSEWMAFDHDARVIEKLKEEYLNSPAVVPRKLSVRNLLDPRWKDDYGAQIGQFDFVYSSGLFDYLTQPVAKSLTRVLFDAVKPGGTLLVANFSQGIRDVGYMETYMDWRLIFRDPDSLAELVLALPRDKVASISHYSEASGTILFSEVTKAE